MKLNYKDGLLSVTIEIRYKGELKKIDNVVI